MGEEVGCSHSTVLRIWNSVNLSPHLLRSFKLSDDPNFTEKVIDVTGLYTNPPPNSIVVCVDEKTQIQALARPQYNQFRAPGHPAGHGRDYKRNGTTTLFAALEVHSGVVHGVRVEKHASKDFINFMEQLKSASPTDKEIHIILDNYAIHKTAIVAEWPRINPNFHFHFAPTYSSWLNLIERWLKELTDKSIRRGSFNSVEELVNKIYSFIERYNNC
jgi:transposase